MKIEVKKIGNSTGVILPKELMSRLNLAQGDWLYVTELPDRSLHVAPYDPEHAEDMKVARELFKEYQETFMALAK